ncbi:O-antigen ligase family protein [Roseateles sp. P5_E1]
MNEILAFTFEVLPYVAALVAAIIVALSIVASGWLADKWSDSSKLAVILGALVVGSALSILLSGRTIYSQDVTLNTLAALQESDQGAGFWASRLTNALILFVSLGEIFRWCTGTRRMASGTKWVLLSFFSFYVASYVAGLLFTTTREVKLGWIYAPTAFTAVALLAPAGMNGDALRKFKWALIGVLAASLVGAAVLPSMTVESGYKSWIPGFSYRLYGFSDHANSLGIVAALAVILELSPLVRKRPNLIFLAISLAALIFTQSKTSWIVALIGAIFVRFEDIRGYSKSSMPGQFTLKLVFAGAVVGSLAALAFALSAYAGLLDRLLNFKEGITFTGRTRIWEISWNELLKNPLFGYGPSIWDPLYRFQNNFMSAGHAHNQFFQTAGQAGIFGLLTLAWYVYLLGRNCAGTWRASSGLAGIAFVSLMIRCFSESPMRLGGLSGMDSVLHLLAFAFAAMFIHSRAPVHGLDRRTQLLHGQRAF